MTQKQIKSMGLTQGVGGWYFKHVKIVGRNLNGYTKEGILSALWSVAWAAGSKDGRNTVRRNVLRMFEEES